MGNCVVLHLVVQQGAAVHAIGGCVPLLGPPNRYSRRVHLQDSASFIIRQKLVTLIMLMVMPLPVHSVTQSARSYPLAHAAPVDVFIHEAGEEVHLPAGRAGDELGHSNIRAGKGGDLSAVVEADDAGHGQGASIAKFVLEEVAPRK